MASNQELSDKITAVNEVLDKDIEQYLVWPGPSSIAGWKGWCLTYINGKPVPTICIQ